jgi:MFS family permease
MQRFPTAKYLSMNIILWGILLALQAVAKNFSTLAVLRGLSGAAEACGDPAFMLITGMWYTRREQPIKIGLWYSSLGLGIAGGGLLGYAIGQIKFFITKLAVQIHHHRSSLRCLGHYHVHHFARLSSLSSTFDY